MDLIFELGTKNDVNELEKLYDDINDHLAKGVNYAGWRKGLYPVREQAEDGVKAQNLYVARHDGRIVGTVILNNIPENAYDQAKWAFESDYSDVWVVHTFVVHPDYLKHGVGKAIMDFSIEHGRKSGIKSIRLDVYENNAPAIRLYEKSGFKYVDTVDLGLGEYGLEWFKLYEIVL